jgi:hypothetical protein
MTFYLKPTLASSILLDDHKNLIEGDHLFGLEFSLVYQAL